MVARRLRGLRITLLAAMGVGAALGCGDEEPSPGNGDGGGLAATGGRKGHLGGEGGRAGGVGTGGNAQGGQDPGVSGGAAMGGAAMGGAAMGGAAMGGAGPGDTIGGGGVGGTGAGGTESGGTIGGGGSGGQGGDYSVCRPEGSPGGGYRRCAGGWMHRPTKSACLPGGTPSPGGGAGGGGGGGGGGAELTDPYTPCSTDSDCTWAPFGFCILDGPEKMCHYGCGADDDCAANEICLCGANTGRYLIGVCARASCTSDADCGSGLCVGEGFSNECTGLPEFSFSCQAGGPVAPIGGSGSVCGRPFLVDGSARSASLALCSGWGNAERVPEQLASRAARQPLAEHWAKLALMEHASVAAFARFALELLSLAAPAEFLTRTQQAMADEIAHAELCFALASAYAERPLAPSALEVGDALSGGLTRCEIVERAFLEACIGETLAVAEAQVALDSARDPAVVAALDRIVQDEARHAELGWRFLAWALRTATPAERSAMTLTLQRRLEHQCRAAASALDPISGVVHPSSALGDSELSDHGLVSARLRQAARRAALDTVVVPCARALGICADAAACYSDTAGSPERGHCFG